MDHLWSNLPVLRVLMTQLLLQLLQVCHLREHAPSTGRSKRCWRKKLKERLLLKVPLQMLSLHWLTMVTREARVEVHDGIAVEAAAATVRVPSAIVDLRRQSGRWRPKKTVRYSLVFLPQLQRRKPRRQLAKPILPMSSPSCVRSGLEMSRTLLF